MVVQSYEYVQNQSLVFFKTVSFMLHELFRYEKKICCVWWNMPLIPAFGREKDVNLCEFKTSLVNIACSRTATAT